MFEWVTYVQQHSPPAKINGKSKWAQKGSSQHQFQIQTQVYAFTMSVYTFNTKNIQNHTQPSETLMKFSELSRTLKKDFIINIYSKIVTTFTDQLTLGKNRYYF